MSKVKVVAFKDGSVLKQNERKPSKGFFRVMSSERTFANGNVNVSKRYATVSIKMTDGEDMELFVGKELDGRIVASESTTPAYEGQEPKRAGGADAPICTLDGQPIYRSTSLESASKADTLIAHNNIQEVKDYQAQTANAGEVDFEE